MIRWFLTNAPSEVLSDPVEVARKWDAVPLGAAALRVVLEDGSVSVGTFAQAKPVLDAVRALRSAK